MNMLNTMRPKSSFIWALAAPPSMRPRTLAFGAGDCLDRVRLLKFEPFLFVVFNQLSEQLQPPSFFRSKFGVPRSKPGYLSEVAPILLLRLDDSRFHCHETLYLACFVANVVLSMCSEPPHVKDDNVPGKEAGGGIAALDLLRCSPSSCFGVGEADLDPLSRVCVFTAERIAPTLKRTLAE